MSEKQALINFHGYDLLTIRTENGIHVVMKYIVEAMGLDWPSQFVRLKKQSKKFDYCDIPTVAIDGKTRDMGGIPLRKLTGWLFSINPENIKNPTVRGTVEIFQEECFHVLHQHWFGKNSEQKETKALPQTFGESLRMLADEWEKNQKLESKIEADKPKVEFAEHMEKTPDSITVRQFAVILKKKGYDTGQNRLFAKFREKGWLKIEWMGGKEVNIPFQHVMEYGWFEFNEYTMDSSDKEGNPKKRLCGKLMVTGKGQVSISKILLRELEK